MQDEKQQKQQEKITQEIKDYRAEEQQILADLKKERDKRMKEIIQDIDKVIKNYAKEKGFDLIINENIVLYGSGVADITQEILKQVNK